MKKKGADFGDLAHEKNVLISSNAIPSAPAITLVNHWHNLQMPSLHIATSSDS